MVAIEAMVHGVQQLFVLWGVVTIITYVAKVILTLFKPYATVD